MATQKLERLGQQNSYDHDTLVKGQKVLESLMVESIDKCRFGGGRIVRRTTTSRPKPTTTTTTTTTASTSTTSLRTPDSTLTENEALALPESIDTYEEEEEEDDLEEDDVEEEEDEVLLSGCLEQTKSGPVKVGVSRPNEAGRDFHLRLCEQESSGGGGGGWTVGRSMSSSVVLALLTCMLLSLGQIRA